MEEVKRWWNGPLCIAGDMNAVRTNKERNRKDGDGDGDSRNYAFLNNFVLNEELIVQPLIAFPNALKIALIRTISDHNPILVITEPSISSKPYFKLEKSWVEHKDFVKNVKIWWRPISFQGSSSYVFFKKLQNLKHMTKTWRIQEFGSVRRENIIVTERIHDLNIMEESDALSLNHLDERLQCKLKLKYIEALEARKWQLRAKQNGFRWGDSNTRYFHGVANSRKKRNTIAKFQIGGVDCFD
ncbi:uncharacterized protein LOC113291150 [Papaver somniferum]|uniref:uncharacterized protein LOC113291150 n=1 Tax=Papaver somniferum TaxID=3469 RepID=UPI000E6FBF69|nr:uncharacterized protein LOC113291150 [Papaver somniferum]